MKNLGRLSSVFILVLMLAGMGQAQIRLERGNRAGSDTKQAATASSTAQQPENPLEVVAAVLQLRLDQIDAVAHLFQAKQEAMTPLAKASQELDAKLHYLLDHDGAAADIGAIVVALNALQGQAAKVQHDFLANFGALLDDSQREKWQNIRQAAAVQPVLNVFEALQLV